MKTLELSQKTRNLFLFAVAIGIISFVAALVTNPSHAWHAYVMNYYLVAMLGIGGCFFVATQHLTSAGWSATVRRIPESFYSFLPAALALFIPIALLGKGIYEWTHAEEVAKDHLLQMKTAYLNVPFFLVRTALFFAVWYFLGGKLVRNSLKQDVEGGIDLTMQNKVYSALFMPGFALLFSFFSVDLIMSLDPHWFSTIFGVVCFANLFLVTLSASIIVLVNLKKGGYFGDSVNENHIQNIGLLMFGFVVFYAYVAFSQFMLIWYGNMPEETMYYARRWENGWSTVAMIIVFVKFVIPFLMLLPREAKRQLDYLKKMAYFVFFGVWLDLFWHVMPAYSDTPFIPIVELGMGIGFVGIFGLVVSNFLGKHPVEPQKDPRVQEALHLHQ